MWNDSIKIDKVFEYFHNRSGKEVTFFLPGYAHNPSLECSVLLPHYRPYDDKAFAFKFNNRDEFYYSYRAFTDFVNLLERHDENFRYCGHTELIFAQYINNGIDFSTIKNFDLTELFYSLKLPTPKMSLKPAVKGKMGNPISCSLSNMQRITQIGR